MKITQNICKVFYHLKFWYHHHLSVPDEKTKAEKEENVLQGHTTYYSKVEL